MCMAYDSSWSCREHAACLLSPGLCPPQASAAQASRQFPPLTQTGQCTSGEEERRGERKAQWGAASLPSCAPACPLTCAHCAPFIRLTHSAQLSLCRAVHAVTAHSIVDRTSHHSSCRRSHCLIFRSSPSSVYRRRSQLHSAPPLAARICRCKNECDKGKLHHRARGGQIAMTYRVHTAVATAATCIRSRSGLRTWALFSDAQSDCFGVVYAHIAARAPSYRISGSH
jgi:hypothetical protein